MSDCKNEMICALHGTQGKYCDEVFRAGITRNSSGYFLAGGICDPARLHVTLVCAVFHAIGLWLLNKAILEKTDLCDGVRAVGGLYLLLFPFDGTEVYEGSLSHYRYEGVRSYPYGTVGKIGALPAKGVIPIALPDSQMKHKIYADQPQRSARFFQKEDGREQFIDHCDMECLAMICDKTASLAEDAVYKAMRICRER